MGSFPQTSCKHNNEYEERLTHEILKKSRAQLYDEVIEHVSERVMCQFQQQFNSYCTRPQVSPPPESFMPPIDKINNHFVLSYELNICTLVI